MQYSRPAGLMGQREKERMPLVVFRTVKRHVKEFNNARFGKFPAKKILSPRIISWEMRVMYTLMN